MMNKTVSSLNHWDLHVFVTDIVKEIRLVIFSAGIDELSVSGRGNGQTAEKGHRTTKLWMAFLLKEIWQNETAPRAGRSVEVLQFIPVSEAIVGLSGASRRPSREFGGIIGPVAV